MPLLWISLAWIAARTPDPPPQRNPKAGQDTERKADAGVNSLLVAEKGWQQLGQSYQLTSDSAVTRDGSVYFTDAHNNRIGKVDPNGKVTIWKDGAGGAHGIAAGPDGRLYAAQHDRKRIVALDRDGKESIVVEGLQTHHFTISQRGEIYCAEGPNHTISIIDRAGSRRVATTEVDWPRGLRISRGRSRLAVTDANTKWVWLFEIRPDGTLAGGQKAYQLKASNESTEVDAGGMTFDTEGFLYVATSLGVQVFDRTRRLTAIIQPPGNNGVTDVFFAGPGMRWLYLKDGERIYRRPSKRRGADL